MTSQAQTGRNPSIIEVCPDEKDDHFILFAYNQNELGSPTCISMKGLSYNPICGRVVWAWNNF